MKDFTDFIKDRKYLRNVSPRTIEFYEDCLRSVNKYGDFSESGIKKWVIGQREAGISARSVNTRITGVNAYLKWAGETHRAEFLKEENKPLAVYGTPAISKILAFKPSARQRRTHTLLLLTFDCGLRVSEAVGLRVSDLDFDNLLISVKGKGNKHRLVPMSQEMRKILWRFCTDRTGFVFSTRDGKALMRRNVLRDVKLLCKRIGVDVPRRSVHAARHTMATDYIRQGGSVVKLQRILGHSNITTTMRYVHLQGQDLIEEHQKLGILGRR